MALMPLANRFGENLASLKLVRFMLIEVGNPQRASLNVNEPRPWVLMYGGPAIWREIGSRGDYFALIVGEPQRLTR
jgi:hypothetical protein